MKRKCVKNVPGRLVKAYKLIRQIDARNWECECRVCGKICNVSIGSFHINKSCGCTRYKKGKNHWHWSGVGDLSADFVNLLKIRAKKKKYEWSIDINYLWDLWLKQDGKCALSGVKLTLPDKCDADRTASLDRIDSSKHYIEGNVQWVHQKMNFMKYTLENKEFLDLCIKVAFSEFEKSGLKKENIYQFIKDRII